MLKHYTYAKVTGNYQDLLSERFEWETEWRRVSEYLVPGRGVYQQQKRPRKRSLTTKKVINTVGEDSLYVLTSGMHGRLTSPAMVWFKFKWTDDKVNKVEAIKAWLEEAEKVVHNALHDSSFYSIINSFYVEYAAFGNAAMYVGEDSDVFDIRFELLTAGEYLFTTDADGNVDTFFRTIFMSARQLVERFGNKSSESVRLRVKNNQAGIDKVDISVIEYVVKYEHDNFPFTRIFYEIGGPVGHQPGIEGKKPLRIDGFNEMPYAVARWGTIGSDVYGVGPGSRALPDIIRLQEMEKAFLMAVHKTLNPPLNVPARMKGSVSTLPGGINYSANPNDVITDLYNVNFNFEGVAAAIERVEERIKTNFFNDVFLTAMRDPNASPLRTGQVNAQEQEKIFRLGPVVERLQSEFFTPSLRRIFNILLRKGKLPELTPELAEMAGDFEISLVSPLAVAQKQVRSQGTQAFMGFLGQAAQFDETILDNINVDKAARQEADIQGVDLGVLRPEEEVQQLRKDRQEAQAAQKQAEAQAQAAQNDQVQSQTGVNDAATQKTRAESGKVLAETQQIAQQPILN